MVTLIPEAETLLRAECRRRRCRFPKVIHDLVRTHLAPPGEEEETAWMAERDAAWERIQKDPRLSHMDVGDEDLTFMSQVINDLILTYLPRA